MADKLLRGTFIAVLPALQAVGDIDEWIHSGSTLPTTGVMQIGIFTFKQSVRGESFPPGTGPWRMVKLDPFLIRRF
jgi:hypothetical protein